MPVQELHLLRHGPAVPHGTEGIADDERPLTPKGRRRVRALADGLDRLHLELDRIVTSPLPRAAETAEIVARRLHQRELLEPADALVAGTHAEAVRDWLAARPESRLMIVGHDPWISDLVGLLLCGQPMPGLVQLRTGGLARLSLREGTTDRYRLDWLARPRLLRLAGQ